jgi:hypothetical protein
MTGVEEQEWGDQEEKSGDRDRDSEAGHAGSDLARRQSAHRSRRTRDHLISARNDRPDAGTWVPSWAHGAA